MKNRLLPLFLVLGMYSAHSQVGIGTLTPSQSAQLEVFSSDKGILIPRVELSSTTDKTTIKNGNVNSLLVFNTKTISDVKPGYYYWYVDKWNRVATADDISGGGNTGSGDGAPGKKGDPGYPGANVIVYTDNSTGTVYVQDADGNWVSINGKDGLPGGQGAPGTR